MSGLITRRIFRTTKHFVWTHPVSVKVFMIAATALEQLIVSANVTPAVHDSVSE